MDLEEAPSDVDTLQINNSSSSSPNQEGKEIGGKEAPENYRILASPERESKRKRGRRALTSMNKGKTGVNQARRTRVRIGRKPAKISGNESDEGGSHDNTLLAEEVDKEERKHGMMSDASLDIRENEAIKDSESLQRDNAAVQEVAEDISFEDHSYQIPDVEMIEKCNIEDSGKLEKLEVMADPVQAMLFDMIPSLAMKKVETTNTSIEKEKPAVDLNAGPSKKKKVSYKDVAGELLKDW